MISFAPEGVIQVQLVLERGRIAAVRLRPRPLPPLKALLKGRQADQAARMLPRLFSLCRIAQTCAALNAIEQALGVAPPPAQSAARLVLTLAETIQEHATRLTLDGPLAFGQAPDVETAKAVRRHIAALVPLICKNDDWVRPGGGRLSPRPNDLADWLEELRRLILSGLMAGRDVSALLEVKDLRDWAQGQGSAPARLLQALLKPGLAGFGASATGLMGHLDSGQVMARLAASDWESYAQGPQTAAGLCLETGPLARQNDHRLIRTLEAESGHGLAARILARLLELAQTLTGIALALPLLMEGEGVDLPVAGGVGLGAAEAARGRLFHWVRLDAGRIEEYRLLAPTEWNFHPEGAFVQGLKGAEAADAETASALARRQGLALDPCVGLEIEVSHA